MDPSFFDLLCDTSKTQFIVLGKNRYFATQCYNGPRSNAACTGLRMFFLDFDKTGDAGVSRLKQDVKSKRLPPPTYITNTSPGKYHAYWLFADVEPLNALTEWVALGKQLATHYGADTNIYDAARIMRVPGSINYKYATPFQTVGAVVGPRTAWAILKPALLSLLAFSDNKAAPNFQLPSNPWEDFITHVADYIEPTAITPGVDRTSSLIAHAGHLVGTGIDNIDAIESMLIKWERSKLPKGEPCLIDANPDAWQREIKPAIQRFVDRAAKERVALAVQELGSSNPPPESGNKKELTAWALTRFCFVPNQTAYFDAATGLLLSKQAFDARWQHLFKNPKLSVLIDNCASFRPDGLTWEPFATLDINGPLTDDWQRGQVIKTTAKTSGHALVAVNTYIPSLLLPQMGSASMWFELLAALLPAERDRTTVLNWMAYLVRHPERRINFGLLLGGKQGIGKDALIAPIVRILGEHNVSYVEEHHIESGFQDAFIGKRLIIVSELYGGDSRKFANRLKPLITNDVLVVNPKGRPAYSVPNHMQFYLMTNYEDSISLEEGDRRFWAQWCGKTTFSPEWFIAYYQQLLKGGLAEAVYDRLLRHNISDFNPGKAPEITAFKQKLIKNSKTNCEYALDEVLNTGAFPSGVLRIADLKQNVTFDLKNYSEKQLAKALRGLGWSDKRCQLIHNNVRKIATFWINEEQHKELTNDRDIFRLYETPSNLPYIGHTFFGDLWSKPSLVT